MAAGTDTGTDTGAILGLVQQERDAIQDAAGRFVALPVMENVPGGRSYSESVIDGNLLLNEGITELWDLAWAGCADGVLQCECGLELAISIRLESARIQDCRHRRTNSIRRMESGYPQRSGQTSDVAGSLGSSDANFAWNEFTLSPTATVTRRRI